MSSTFHASLIRFSGDSLLRRWQKSSIQAGYPNGSSEDIDYILQQSSFRKMSPFIGLMPLGALVGAGLGYGLKILHRQGIINRLAKGFSPISLAVVGGFVGQIVAMVKLMGHFRTIYKNRPHLITENPVFKAHPMKELIERLLLPK